MNDPLAKADLERRLRAEAADFRGDPPADLAAGIIAGLRGQLPPQRAEQAAPPWRWWLPAALAAVVAVASAVALLRPDAGREVTIVRVRPEPAPAVQPRALPLPTAPLADAPLALAAPTRALSSECRRMGDDVAAAYRVVLACVPSTPRPAAP